MKPLKTSRKRLLTSLLLLSLFFQVQTVFACQMVESHRGLASDCCCESMVMQGEKAPVPSSDNRCCDLENTLSLKNSDGESPSIIQARLLPDLSHTSLAFVLISLELLAKPTRPPSGLTDIRDNPSSPGSITWLQTRRLRI